VRGVLDAHKYKDFIERRALVHALVWKEEHGKKSMEFKL